MPRATLFLSLVRLLRVRDCINFDSVGCRACEQFMQDSIDFRKKA
jgi:hypothetical protein